MKCRQFERHEEDWQADRAPEAFARHLEQCADCRQQAETLERSAAWMELLRQEPPQLSPAFWVQFWEREAASAGAFWQTLIVMSRRAVLALALALFLLFAGVLWTTEPEEPAVAGFDSHQPYWVEVSGQTNGGGNGPNREQVVLTLVAQSE